MRLPNFASSNKVQRSALIAFHIHKEMISSRHGKPDLFEYEHNDLIAQAPSWEEKGPIPNSKFDQALKDRWDTAMENGFFRYNIDHIITRILPGPKRYVAQLNTLRASKRRKPQTITSLTQPFDKKTFNFTDVRLDEVVFDIRNKSRTYEPVLDKKNESHSHETLGMANGGSKESNDSHSKNETNDDTASFVINVSPMEYGHCLMVPQRLACQPQILTKKALTIAVETMLLSNQRSLRMGYNSLCAFASVNHLHFHFFYLEYELIADYCPMKHLGGRIYEFNAVPCPGFGVQLHGSSVDEMVSLGYGISSYLHENDVAHNVFLCRGVVFNEPRDSHLTTLRLFIWPRKKFIGIKSSEEFNVACIELGGHLPIRIEKGYYTLSEAEVDDIITGACLPPSEYEAIKEYVIKLGLERDVETPNS